MKTIFEKAGITYHLAEDGMYYPDLKLPEDEEPHYGRYGRMRKTFHQEHRIDNPYLGDELKKEKESILLWALEGLSSLLANDYRFTISERTAKNLKVAMARANFLHYLKENQKSIGIIYDAKCIDNCRDFHNVDLHPFTLTRIPCLWDK